MKSGVGPRVPGVPECGRNPSKRIPTCPRYPWAKDKISITWLTSGLVHLLLKSMWNSKYNSMYSATSETMTIFVFIEHTRENTWILLQQTFDLQRLPDRRWLLRNELRKVARDEQNQEAVASNKKSRTSGRVPAMIIKHDYRYFVWTKKVEGSTRSGLPPQSSIAYLFILGQVLIEDLPQPLNHAMTSVESTIILSMFSVKKKRLD